MDLEVVYVEDRVSHLQALKWVLARVAERTMPPVNAGFVVQREEAPEEPGPSSFLPTHYSLYLPAK
ncbi:MAG: hypothetical protein U0641_05585 [Anaerolineae bacterium]